MGEAGSPAVRPTHLRIRRRVLDLRGHRSPNELALMSVAFRLDRFGASPDSRAPAGLALRLVVRLSAGYGVNEVPLLSQLGLVVLASWRLC
jgi:hypothetical protein